MKRYDASRTRRLCRAAMIAALYVVLTWVSALLGLDSTTPQCRFAEALCILPLFFPEAVSGLAIGCFAANLLFCPTPPDLIFGTLATLLGALGCRLVARVWKNHSPWRTMVATLPNILSNAVIIPLVLRYGYGLTGTLPYLFLSVAVGEILSGGILGVLLASLLPGRIKQSHL